MSGQWDLQLIRSVQSANDIVDVVGEHVALKRAGKNLLGLCPFHREKTPSFSVSAEKQFFHCFGCGAGGDVVKFVQKILNITFVEAIEVLARRAGIPLPERGKKNISPDGFSKEDIFKANLWACKYYTNLLWNTPIGEPGRKYLIGRGLTEEICKTFMLGFSSPDGRNLLEAAGKHGLSPQLLKAAGLATDNYNSFRDLFRGRVIFPIFDPMGNIVGFGGRTLGDDQPKYLNTPETPVFQKQRNLFGLFLARDAIREKKQVVVVEGYTDCMAPFQAGVKNVVATLGTALTEQHVQTLRRYADEIVLIFDSDQAGVKAADRALNVFLAMGVDVKVAQVPSGKDPCDLVIAQGAQAFESVIAGAVDSLEYKWRRLQQQYNVGAGERERRSAIDNLLETIATCDPYGRIDVIRKGMLMGRLASMLSVPVEHLYAQLQRYRRRLPESTNTAQNNQAVRPTLPVAETPSQSAFMQLLEILICEPGYIAHAAEKLNPDDFEPEIYRKIAEKLWLCHNQLGEFSFTELLGVVEDANLADIITQLYKQGRKKGNFDQNLEDAMRCIEDTQREQDAARNAAGMNQTLTEDEVDRQLQELYENLKVSVRRTPGALVE